MRTILLNLSFSHFLNLLQLVTAVKESSNRLVRVNAYWSHSKKKSFLLSYSISCSSFMCI